MVLADYAEYIKAQDRADALFQVYKNFNIAFSFKFTLLNFRINSNGQRKPY